MCGKAGSGLDDALVSQDRGHDASRTYNGRVGSGGCDQAILMHHTAVCGGAASRKGRSSETDGHIRTVVLMHHHQGVQEGRQWTA